MILLIDAEHSQLQPAVRLISLAMMADFNRKDGGDGVVLCNTYQCYLKDTLNNVKEDLEVHVTNSLFYLITTRDIFVSSWRRSSDLTSAAR